MTAWPPFPAAPTLCKHKHTHAHTPSYKHKHTLFANTNDPLCKHAVARTQTHPSPGPRPPAPRSTPRPPCLQVTILRASSAQRSKCHRLYQHSSNANLCVCVSHFEPRQKAVVLLVCPPTPISGCPSFKRSLDTILCLHPASSLRPDNWQHSCCVLRVQKRGIPKRCDLERRKKQFSGLSVPRRKGPGKLLN